MKTNQLEIIILISMAILLFIWIIGCSIYYAKKTKKDAIQLDFDVQVKCDTCQTIYHKKAADFVKGHFVKQKSITRTKAKGAVLINEPEYLYYGKKFDCPTCQKRVYGQVFNLNEIQQKTRKIAIQNACKTLILMCIGGMVIVGCTMIPMSYVRHLRNQEIQELKQKQRHPN